MTLLRRIAGGVAFVVALITFLLCVAGAIGAWYVRPIVNATSLAAIDTLDDYLDLTIQTIDTLNANVAGLERTLGVLRSKVTALRAKRTDEAVAQQIEQTVTDELQPALEQLTLRAERLDNGLGRFNQRLEQFNRLPFRKVPALPSTLATLDEQVATARAQVQIMRTAIENRDPASLEAAVENTAQRLDRARVILAEVSARATTSRAALSDIRQALPFWLTVITLVVSVLLTIFAAGQFSLAVHAWGWIRQRS